MSGRPEKCEYPWPPQHLRASSMPSAASVEQNDLSPAEAACTSGSAVVSPYAWDQGETDQVLGIRNRATARVRVHGAPSSSEPRLLVRAPPSSEPRLLVRAPPSSEPCPRPGPALVRALPTHLQLADERRHVLSGEAEGVGRCHQRQQAVLLNRVVQDLRFWRASHLRPGRQRESLGRLPRAGQADAAGPVTCVSLVCGARAVKRT